MQQIKCNMAAMSEYTPLKPQNRVPNKNLFKTVSAKCGCGILQHVALDPQYQLINMS